VSPAGEPAMLKPRGIYSCRRALCSAWDEDDRPREEPVYPLSCDDGCQRPWQDSNLQPAV
jgi:hypothetical protein